MEKQTKNMFEQYADIENAADYMLERIKKHGLTEVVLTYQFIVSEGERNDNQLYAYLFARNVCKIAAEKTDDEIAKKYLESTAQHLYQHVITMRAFNSFMAFYQTKIDDGLDSYAEM